MDVRKEDAVPERTNIEYRYSLTPAEITPPVGSNYLVHLFQNPKCAGEEALCLERFLKKLKEKLLCKGGIKPGWGLQFVKGWNMKKIWIINFVFFSLGSLSISIL